MIAGPDYGVEGMRVGGRRLIRVGPPLAYREQGVPDAVPANTVLEFRVTLLDVQPIASRDRLAAQLWSTGKVQKRPATHLRVRTITSPDRLFTADQGSAWETMPFGFLGAEHTLPIICARKLRAIGKE